MCHRQSLFSELGSNNKVHGRVTGRPAGLAMTGAARSQHGETWVFGWACYIRSGRGSSGRQVSGADLTRLHFPCQGYSTFLFLFLFFLSLLCLFLVCSALACRVSGFVGFKNPDHLSFSRPWVGLCALQPQEKRGVQSSVYSFFFFLSLSLSRPRESLNTPRQSPQTRPPRH